MIGVHRWFLRIDPVLFPAYVRLIQHMIYCIIIKEWSLIQIIVHASDTSEARQIIHTRIVDLHADYIIQKVSRLHCPQAQKQELIDAIFATITKRKNNTPSL